MLDSYYITFVVYFDQQTGAPHAVRWSKSFVFIFLRLKHYITHYVLPSRYLLYYLFGRVVIFSRLVWPSGQRNSAVWFLFIRLSGLGRLGQALKLLLVLGCTLKNHGTLLVTQGFPEP